MKNLTATACYKLEFANTWSDYGQSRIVCYVSEDLHYKRQSETIRDLPNITIEIGLGREKKTIVNIFYREWTNGISGLSSHVSQVER